MGWGGVGWGSHTRKDAYMCAVHAQARLAMVPTQIPPPQCPPRYRLLQPQDLAVDLPVLYISRLPETPQLRPTLLDVTQIGGDKIKSQHKSEATMNPAGSDGRDQGADGRPLDVPGWMRHGQPPEPARPPPRPPLPWCLSSWHRNKHFVMAVHRLGKHAWRRRRLKLGLRPSTMLAGTCKRRARTRGDPQHLDDDPLKGDRPARGDDVDESGSSWLARFGWGTWHTACVLQQAAAEHDLPVHEWLAHFGWGSWDAGCDLR